MRQMVPMVWACAQTASDEFESYCRELSQMYNVWITPVYFDLLNTDEIKAAVKSIQTTKLPVDILVNIAGVAKDALFHHGVYGCNEDGL